MCEPTTVLAGAAVLGAGVSIYGQLQQGKSQKEQAEQQAQIFEYQKRDAQQQGAYEAARIMSEARGLAATQRTGLAASGVDQTSGSAANLLAGTMGLAAVDAARARSNAARAAWGFTTQAQQSRAAGAAAQRASVFGSIATGLSGVVQAGSIAYGGYRPGAAPAPTEYRL